jgi:hypothetical protein
MIVFRHPLLLATLAGALVVPIESPASAAPDRKDYDFTVIADSADGFEFLPFACAAINDAGQVAFGAVDERTGQGVYRGDGSELTTIFDDRPDKYDNVSNNPSINEAGQVSAAVALEGSGEAILRGDGTTLDTVAATAGSDFGFLNFGTSINEAGRVAFKADLENGDKGMFSAVTPANSKTYYLASNSRFAGDPSAPFIRGRAVAFTDDTDGGDQGVFLWRNGAIETVIGNIGGQLGIGNPSLSRRGRVAVQAYNDAASTEFILTARDGCTRVLASTEGKFSAFGIGTPSINSSGQVAYSASVDDDLANGAYVGRGRPVLEVGDPLADSTLIDVMLCTEGLNDLGQLALVAQLADGRTVVARANPVLATEADQ